MLRTPENVLFCRKRRRFLYSYYNTKPAEINLRAFALFVFSAAVNMVEAVVIVTLCVLFSATFLVRAAVFLVCLCAESVFFFALFATFLADLFNFLHRSTVHSGGELFIVHNLIFEQEFDDKVELGAVFGENTFCFRICAVNDLLYLLVDKRGSLFRIVL